MNTHARVVIVGGGMMGVGLAYHLGLEGWPITWGSKAGPIRC
jgi:glycine/D-amino acid oxidase-like deaminating enzyme